MQYKVMVICPLKKEHTNVHLLTSLENKIISHGGRGGAVGGAVNDKDASNVLTPSIALLSHLKRHKGYDGVVSL